jgi:hypothetical protein
VGELVSERGVLDRMSAAVDRVQMIAAADSGTVSAALQ